MVDVPSPGAQDADLGAHSWDLPDADLGALFGAPETDPDASARDASDQDASAQDASDQDARDRGAREPGPGDPSRGARQADPGRPTRGGQRDFNAFYTAHFKVLALQLHAYAGDLTEAQDLVQEAFCRAYTRWDQVAEYDDPVAWVRRVAWNLATSRWRRQRRAAAYLLRQREQHEPGPNPDRVAVVQALRSLPERQRRAVVLHHVADLSVAEIAAQEGVAEGTVKSWLHRGRIALAATLSDVYKESRDG